MKKLLVFVLCFGFLMFMTSLARATLFEFTFDPNDFFVLTGAQIPDESGPDSPEDNKSTQHNPRRVHDNWGSTYYQTFDGYMDPDKNGIDNWSQPNSYNTYLNWMEGLGAGEGISRFNMWLLDNPAAQSWGEEIVANVSYVPSATAAAGWNVQVISNPWGPGYLVEWWTDNSVNYLRPGGADIGMFSFTTDALQDSNGDGIGDTELVEGIGYRIWFGAYNGDSTDYSVHFDNDWGTTTDHSPNYGVFAADGNSGWEGVLEVKGTVVPEPATMMLFGAGLIGLAGLGRKKFFK